MAFVIFIWMMAVLVYLIMIFIKIDMCLDQLIDIEQINKRAENREIVFRNKLDKAMKNRGKK